jgi:hypothetical protein
MHHERDGISMKKQPLTDRENKFNKMLTAEHRNNSLKNLHPTSMRQKSIISLANTMPRPASTDRLKIVLPTDPHHITAMYNVKMNFNINKDVINNNYVTNPLTSTKLFSNNGTKKNLEKLYLSKQQNRPKSKEKYIKLDKSVKTPQGSGGRFYPISPNTSNSSRVAIKDKDGSVSSLSSNRNCSESRISIDASMKSKGSENKMYTHSSKVSPSPGSRTNIFRVQNDSSSSESSFNIEKVLSKKSQIKKKLK